MPDERPVLRWTGICLDCADADEMARFYEALLGWEVELTDGKGWIKMRDPRRGTDILLQADPAYRAPVWPEVPEGQDKMMHFEVKVDDLEAAVMYAVAIGAREAPWQPRERITRLRVMLDPAGHPFCLYLD